MTSESSAVSFKPTPGVARPLPWLTATLLFLFASLAYFGFRSPALDEHDSVQFAMAVRNFNIWEHQPHPPGYPLYIFFGWIGTHFFHASPEDALHFVSALGGALFLAVWFLIIWLQFGKRLACWITLTLFLTPAIWMTATKVLTDSLASGFVSAELLAALCFLKWKRGGALQMASLMGAAAAGARPQMIAVVLAILITSLWQSRSRAGQWISVMATLIGACLLWLLPMWYIQWRIHPETPAWLVYPKLVYGQWRWRLDKPGTYIGAGDWSPRYLGTRIVSHFLAWFGLGFGFLASIWALVIGSVMVVLGFIFYARQPLEPADREFWRQNLPWALIHVLIIFISLSGAQRYYLLVFPLLLVALGRAFYRMARPWNLATVAFPLLLLLVLLPLGWQNHLQEPPARRLVRYLEQIYPPAKRGNVVLLFMNVRRHAEWYAPGFVTFRDLPALADLPPIVENAAAIYTDDKRVPLPEGWHRTRLAEFERSEIIYMKHHDLELFSVERDLPLTPPSANRN